MSSKRTLKEIMSPTDVKNAGTYHYSALARKFVKLDRVSLTPVARATLFVGGVEDVEIAVINAVAEKDIGDEFND